MKHLSIFCAGLCILLVSCATNSDSDINLIETIENKLLPSLLVEGEVVEGFSIQERMEYYHVPGVSIAFLNEGKIAWAKGYGFTSADSSRLVDEHTLFQAASISKPVAALAALALVEEGKIGLDDDVNLYLNCLYRIPAGCTCLHKRCLDISWKVVFDESKLEIFYL